MRWDSLLLIAKETRHRGVEPLAWGYTASKWQSWDWDPGSLSEVLSVLNQDVMLPAVGYSEPSVEQKDLHNLIQHIKYLPLWNKLNIQKFHLTVEWPSVPLRCSLFIMYNFCPGRPLKETRPFNMPFLQQRQYDLVVRSVESTGFFVGSAAY